MMRWLAPRSCIPASCELADQFWREPPGESAGRLRREFVKGNEAAATLLEGQVGVAAGTDEPCGHACQVRFVTYHEDAPTREVFGQERDEFLRGPARLERITEIHGNFLVERIGNDF